MAGTWVTRHPGADATWLVDVPAALAFTLDRPSLDAVSLLALFALWWRGLRTGTRGPSHASTVQAFGIGALVLAAALLVSVASGASAVALAAGILAFLGAGLPALSLARLEEIRGDLAAGAARGQPAQLDSSWLRSLLPPVALVLAVGTLAAVLLAEPHVRSAVLGAAGFVGNLVLAVLYWPLLLVGLLAEWLVYVLRQLVRGPREQISPPPAPADWEDLIEQLRRTEYETAGWIEYVRWALLAAGAAAVVFAFWRSARAGKLEQDALPAAGAKRESLGAWDVLWADIRAALRALLRRLRRRAEAALALAPLPGLPAQRSPRPDHGADARAAYRRLLALGREHELPREPSQTPGEYLGAWRAALPGERDAGALTASYAQARYGPAPAPPEPEGRLRELIGRLETALRTWRGERERQRPAK